MSEYRKLKSLKFLYEINSEGILRNIKSKKIVTGYVEKNGYVRVRIENKCLGGVIRTTIHQLVAEAFIPNPENKPFVNHIDSNRSNNNVNNLEWVTHSENMIHAYYCGKCSKQIQNNLSAHSTSTRKKVTNGIDTFGSISDAGKYLEKENRTSNWRSGACGISAVLRGKRKSFGGYKWKYV